jgi:hypothetical protein
MEVGPVADQILRLELLQGGNIGVRLIMAREVLKWLSWFFQPQAGQSGQKARVA